MNKSIISFLSVVALLMVLTSCEEQEKIIPAKKNIEDAVFASGYVEQENNYTVSTKVEGILLSLSIKEGVTVEKNDRIALIENEIQNNQLQDAQVVYEDAVKNASPASPQLQHIQTQIAQAKQQLSFDKENYERYKSLWEQRSVAKVDVEKTELQYKAAQSNLESLEKQYEEAASGLELSVQRSLVQVNNQKSMLSDYALITKEAGIVIDLFKKEGELVRKGEAVAKIGSGDYIIKLFVAEDDITKVNLGQSVAVNINTYPDETYYAAISKIYPAFDANEQSYIVEAQFKDLPEKMFSGTQLQANIQTGKRRNVLVIPTDYVARGTFVILESGEEKQIKTGSKNDEWTEVVAGLTEQDIIIKPIN